MISRRMLVVVVALAHVAGLARPAGAAPLPLEGRLAEPVSDSAAVFDGRHIYVFGGFNRSGAFSAAIQRFTPGTGASTVVASLPSPRIGASAVWTGSDALVFGGYSGADLTEIVRFTPSTGSVSVIGRLPFPLLYSSAVWDGSSAYLLGGYVTGGGVLTASIVKYTPASGATAVVASLPSARSRASAVWDGTGAYLFGGLGAGNALLADIVRFDPATNAASTLSVRLPSARSDTSAVWDGGRAWIFGGDRRPDKLSDIVRFSPSAMEVTTSPDKLQVGAGATSAVAAPPYAYVLGGWTNQTLLDLVQRVDIAGPGLSVRVTGKGTGTVRGPGIDCGTTCTAKFPEGTSVELTATPGPASRFAGWSGACGGTGTCRLTMGTAATVSARFDAELSVLVTGSHTYGGTARSLRSSFDGLVEGDGPSVVGGELSCTVAVPADTPVGSYADRITDCGGLAADGYVLRYVDGGFTVVPAPLELSAQDSTRPYGRPNPRLESTVSGFVLGEDGVSARLSGTPECSTTAVSDSVAGRYPIVCERGTLTAPNYEFTTFTPGTLTITKVQPLLQADSAIVVGPRPSVFTLRAVMSRSDDGTPIAGRVVGFVTADLSRVLCWVVTDENGVGTCDVRSEGVLWILAMGGYRASFAGDGGYLPAEASAGLLSLPA